MWSEEFNFERQAMENFPLMIDEKTVVIRLIIAAFLGASIGLEREARHQPAGLRTHIILSIGSALAMCLSIDLAMQFRAMAPNGDPARLAAQVVSGIGFLGAGAILKFGATIKGLTTATSLWTVAIIGLSVGGGHFFAAGVATVLLLVVLGLLNIFEKRFIGTASPCSISVKAHDREHLVNDIRALLSTLQIEIKSISVSKNNETNEIEIDAMAMFPAKQNMDDFIGSLSALKDVKSFDVH
jgi:putative Mg2+ transporter-C (MgtC) family protein